MSSHLFHLSHILPHNQGEGGFRIKGTKKLFPMLEGMSLYKLHLFERGIREPHWHPNADEMGYCLKGNALVSFYGNHDLKESFLVNPGEVFFIPSGFFHHIENIGEGDCEMVLKFSHDKPEDFSLSEVMGIFSNKVLGNTWGVDEKRFSEFKRVKEAVFATLRNSEACIPNGAKYESAYKYNLQKAEPLLLTEEGFAKVARESTWPILKQAALYSLEITKEGMREPHWHPNTSEMGYVSQGKGRMTVQSSDQSVETYVMEQGDLYFIPKAYPHHIENLTNDSLHILIFFDQAIPGDIGFTGSIKSFSNEVLESVLNVPETFFESLPTYYKDSFIVKRVNPLD